MERTISSAYTIRTMTRPEIDWAVELAAAEGWNPGLHDADVFYATDPDGFLIGELDGKPISCVSAVRYDGGFGFIGFYIVLPEYRGKGYGMEIFQKALDRLDDGTIGADGVFERLADYESIGFRLAYRNIRFEHRKGNEEKEKLQDDTPTFSIHPISQVPSDQILSYDRQCFPVERSNFLKKWVAMPESYGVAAVEENEVKGYGLIRSCRSGYKIGPLFADDEGTADELFRQLCTYAEDGEPIYLDIPETNAPGMMLAQRYGMKMVFGTGRIYIGPEPEMEVGKIFGVTTFELG